MLSILNLTPSEKNQESSYQIRQILGLFCKSRASFLVKTVSKALELKKLSSESNLKRPGAS